MRSSGLTNSVWSAMDLPGFEVVSDSDVSEDSAVIVAWTTDNAADVSCPFSF